MSEEKEQGITDYKDLPEHPGYIESQTSSKAPHTVVTVKKQRQRRINVRS